MSNPRLSREFRYDPEEDTGEFIPVNPVDLPPWNPDDPPPEFLAAKLRGETTKSGDSPKSTSPSTGTASASPTTGQPPGENSTPG